MHGKHQSTKRPKNRAKAAQNKDKISLEYGQNEMRTRPKIHANMHNAKAPSLRHKLQLSKSNARMKHGIHISSEMTCSMTPKHGNTTIQACKKLQNSKLGMGITLQARIGSIIRPRGLKTELRQPKI